MVYLRLPIWSIDKKKLYYRRFFLGVVPVSLLIVSFDIISNQDFDLAETVSDAEDNNFSCG